MVLNNFENNKLFGKTVPICIKDVYTNQTRTKHLFLRMEWQDASAGMYSKKELVISLTDDNDPFFLYNLHLSEEDFQLLKSSQELLINFASFPQHITSYIEKCLIEEKNPQPKFLLIFTINEKLGNIATSSQLDIIETNQFKNLTHLSLQFVAASESEKHQYILSCVKKLKEENKELHASLSFSEQDKKEKLTTKECVLHSMEQELERLKTQFSAELRMKDNKHNQELQEEKDRFHQKLREEEEKYENEIKEKDKNCRKEIQRLESRLNVLDTLNKDLQEQNFKHESTIRQLRVTIQSSEDEIKRLNDSLQNYQHKCDDLQTELKRKQLHINNLEEKIKELQLEIHSKDHSIARLNKQVEFESKRRNSLEKEVDDVKFDLNMSEKTKKVLIKEKGEFSDIILRLQNQIAELRSEAELATKYKEITEEKEKLLQDAKKKTEDLNILLKVKDDDIGSLKGSISTLQEKIKSLENEIKRERNINAWLTKHQAEQGILPQYTPVTDFNISPSNVAQKQLARISCSANHNSPGLNNLPSEIAANKVASKSVRSNTPPALRKNTSTPSRFHNLGITDSAYATFPSGNQETPENVCRETCVKHIADMNAEQEADFDIDTAALNAAFGQGDHVLKHSTAKKPAKPVKSTTSKVTKKR